jgi:hypothetical protein
MAFSFADFPGGRSHLVCYHARQWGPPRSVELGFAGGN